MNALSANRIKIAVGLFGTGLCVAGLWYLIVFISHIDLAPHLAALDTPRLVALAALTLCLSLAYVLIALSWRAILKDYGGQISYKRAQLIFSIANIGKYIPGNVFHMAGRQVLTMREGVPGWVVTKSLVIETVLLALTSAVFAGAFWLVSRLGGVTGFLSSLFLFLILVVGVLALQRFGSPGSARAILGYCLYHLIGGVVFALLFLLLSDDTSLDVSLGFILVAAYVASWFIGLVTPGAPAGVGVREALLLGLLTGLVPNETVLGAAVLLSRGMSILSDVTYYLVLHGLHFHSLRATFPWEKK